MDMEKLILRLNNLSGIFVCSRSPEDMLDWSFLSLEAGGWMSSNEAEQLGDYFL